MKYKDKVSLEDFKYIIDLAYYKRDRDIIEAAGHLQCEASELAELFLKEKWYGREFTNDDLLSEAGDILNFLTFILSKYSLTLDQAIENNINKLKSRGWVKL